MTSDLIIARLKTSASGLNITIQRKIFKQETEFAGNRFVVLLFLSSFLFLNVKFQMRLHQNKIRYRNTFLHPT